MSSKTVVGIRVFDRIGGNAHIAALRVRVGVVFPAETAPQQVNVHNMVSFAAPKGAPRQKYYCPAQGVDLLENGAANYSVDYSVAHAPHAELLLNQIAGTIVWFGRFGEKVPFSFDVGGGHYYCSLRINRAEDGGFVPLYISARRGEEVRFFRLDAEWSGNTIAVSVRQVEEEDAPEFLRFRGETVYSVESSA